MNVVGSPNRLPEDGTGIFDEHGGASARVVTSS
jgi:hypothetical protein